MRTFRRMSKSKEWNESDVVAMMDQFGLTNQALADLCGVHWTTVSRWRNGQNKPEGMAKKLLSMVEAQLQQEAKKGKVK